MATLSIIIPAFNEEACLPALFAALEPVINNALKNHQIEVIIVDDHSSDQTPELLNKASASHRWLSYIRLLRNSGSHVAILAGLTVCKGDMAFIMGADLQDPPEIIPSFIAKLSQGYKIVLGERTERRDPILKRVFAGIFNYLMCRFVLENFPVNGGDVFLLDRDIIDAVIQCEEKNVNIFVLILSLCKDVGVVKYERAERYAGESKWNLPKLIKLGYDSVITVGYVPLRIVLWGGVLSFLLSLFVICYLLIGKLTGIISVQGWASLLAAVLALGGLNLVSISVLGEYLWRKFDQSRKRPMYIVQKSHLTNQDQIGNQRLQ